MFTAMLIDETPEGPRGQLVDLDEAALPDGPVSVEVAYSSLNYKDALAVTGAAPIARSLPMVAGIDLAGTITGSDDPAWPPGSQVVVTGCGIGERHWGGLAQRARLATEWLVPLPDGLTAHQAMQVGTAGVTAMLAVMALERHGAAPGEGPVLVTGASGGVGGLAIMLLARRGYAVTASTGRAAEGDYLRALGAEDVIPRSELSEPGRPLGSARWAAAVDTVGGHTLANACSTLRRGGVVAACGNASGMELPGSVAPFILRGVTMAGIDSVETPWAWRREAWSRLAAGLDLDLLGTLTEDVGLTEVPEASRRLLDGRVRGRLVVDCGR